METSPTTRFDLLSGSPIGAPSNSALDSPSGGGCCGGGSCMCGSGGGAAAFDLSGSRGLVAPTSAMHDDHDHGDHGDHAHGAAQSVGVSVASTEFLVTGMTCGHCVASVTEEVGAVAGVSSVEVVLKKGGASRVTVTAEGPIERDAVRAAVEEAGYQLA